MEPLPTRGDSLGHTGRVAAGPVGDLLDERYELGAVIGVGGMGEVRSAFDRKLGREVAVKFLRAELAQQGEVRHLFEQEARSAARPTASRT